MRQSLSWVIVPSLVLLLVAVVRLPITTAAPAPVASPSAEQTLWQPYRITPRSGSQHIALDGRWQLAWRDSPIRQTGDLDSSADWIDADVPNSVQWALHRAGRLPHPYAHLNSAKYSWVDEKVWYYRRKIDLPKLENNPYVFLCFDGIDYFARVWLNGQLLGRHEGMFGGPSIEVSKHARPGGPNEIVVEVRAGNYGNKKEWKPRGPEGTVVKPWVIAGGTGGEMFFPLGMWRGARLEIVARTHLERPFLVTQVAKEDEARLRLEAEVLAGQHSLELSLHPWKNTALVPPLPSREDLSGKLSSFALRIELREKAAGKMACSVTAPLTIRPGRNFIHQELSIPRPRLWWPNGMGQADLYTVKLTLLRDGKAEDSLAFDYGIRTIGTVASRGPRTADRWADWQFVVNGRPLFVKGLNWMPADILLDLPRQRYRWLLEAAQAAGIQMLRIWGGGLLETEDFYELAGELGIMVWQDFPIGNRDTPEWPQDVWESQVMQTIFRIRNHPALALYCGGNEFNPYSAGNAATIGIWERCLADFDPMRIRRRTSPDAGSTHTYPDMDPTWYARLYRDLPYMAETGMHNIPEPRGLRELVDPREFEQPLAKMFAKGFSKEHPELIHHFVEYMPSRVPRMLSRASHIDDMNAPTLEALAEATQIGAGEFYQVFSEQLQANYPITTGLMPWVYKRPWPVIAIMLMDGFGQPTAPYYFLKRTYEPTHISVQIPHLLWAAGESLPVEVRVTHAATATRGGLQASVEILDASFRSEWKQERCLELAAGPSVAGAELGRFVVPQRFEETFFFLVAELRDSDGRLVSRSVYWPRCLAQMRDEAFRTKQRQSPQPMLTFDRGPWLKPQSAAQPTSLELTVVGHQHRDAARSRIEVRLRNTGKVPAMNTQLDIEGADRAFYSTDNFFWLAPGEERPLCLEVLWREPKAGGKTAVTAAAWNAAVQRRTLP